MQVMGQGVATATVGNCCELLCASCRGSCCAVPVDMHPCSNRMHSCIHSLIRTGLHACMCARARTVFRAHTRAHTPLCSIALSLSRARGRREQWGTASGCPRNAAREGPPAARAVVIVSKGGAIADVFVPGPLYSPPDYEHAHRKPW